MQSSLIYPNWVKKPLEDLLYLVRYLSISLLDSARPLKRPLFLFLASKIFCSYLPPISIVCEFIFSIDSYFWVNLLKTNQFIVVIAGSSICRTILPVNMKMYKIAHYYRNQSQYHIYSHSFAHENSHMGVIHRTIIRIMPLMTIIRLLTLNLMLICRV